eukprot:CAMPEP_0177397106 /NCGR_PEP_ID=MMETSP0368-20130122/57130_1 /TAXON_ID=447022 ORGANISM="Scrippsiella hangoei-like, Strain SHHI-4" /NCGR_SAMPLE_ID=MMETSP0368 /ASSEMBLY_ACC=CAM_ASM_000363 /LENGTH=42 /DNA_ID= /DNA_START= /DNA_END= /DNA_ORIENTATION=
MAETHAFAVSAAATDIQHVPAHHNHRNSAPVNYFSGRWHKQE